LANSLAAAVAAAGKALLVLLAEPLLLLLGLQLMPVRMLVLLFLLQGLQHLLLLSFSPPRPPYYVFYCSPLRAMAGSLLPCMHTCR
jgi:hypothetical protein